MGTDQRTRGGSPTASRSALGSLLGSPLVATCPHRSHSARCHPTDPACLPWQPAQSPVYAAGGGNCPQVGIDHRCEPRQQSDIVQLLGVPESRVHVVHHGPNVEAAQLLTTRTALRTKYNLPERYFLYLGGFDVRKNLRGILAAYQRYLESGGDPGIKLLIAGKLPTTDSAFMPDPRPIAAEFGLTAQVHFCGWVDDADKAALYAAATAFLFPTLYEGFGMMVLEAQAAGARLSAAHRPRAGDGETSRLRSNLHKNLISS